MFIGEYNVQIGEKNRISIPKKLRDNLNGPIIITRGYERCLIAVDSKNWENLLTQINEKPLLTLNVRDTKRFLIGGATEVEYDTQGRFVLPESLMKFASIQNKITFLGVGEWIEIWDEDRWNNKLNELSSNVADIAERLSEK